jgi:hypothetical protein
MLFSLLNPIVRTKRRNPLGSAVFDCERYSWPHVQAVPRLRNCDEPLGSNHNGQGQVLSSARGGAVPCGRGRSEVEREAQRAGGSRLKLRHRRRAGHPQNLGQSFINCQVRDCDLFYSGGDFDWQGGQFQNCRFHFRGPAKNMLTLCQIIGMIPTSQTQLPPTNVTPPKPN